MRGCWRRKLSGVVGEVDSLSHWREITWSIVEHSLSKAPPAERELALFVVSLESWLISFSSLAI